MPRKPVGSLLNEAILNQPKGTLLVLEATLIKVLQREEQEAETQREQEREGGRKEGVCLS